MAYSILDAREKREIALGAFLEAVRDRDVIYIGELHQLPEVLSFQVDVLRGLVRAGLRPAVGLEMFNVLQQGLIDGYLSGDITLKALMEIYEEGPEGFDMRHYRDILDAAAEYGLKALALNIPRDVAAAVARRGLERAELEGFGLREEEVRACSTGCRKALAAVYRKHPHGEVTEDNFVLAQCIKDEMMAETIAGRMEEGKPLLVIAGRGHTESGLGVPERVRRKMERAGKRLSDVLVASAYSDEGYGLDATDYLVIVRDESPVY
jgi:uncharacterized iron-regulated protein